jgi:hypothetical protein
LKVFFLSFWQEKPAIMHLALPPPQASIVSKLELRIVACFSNCSICFGLSFDVQQHSSLNIFYRPRTSSMFPAKLLTCSSVIKISLLSF